MNAPAPRRVRAAFAVGTVCAVASLAGCDRGAVSAPAAATSTPPTSITGPDVESSAPATVPPRQTPSTTVPPPTPMPTASSTAAPPPPPPTSPPPTVPASAPPAAPAGTAYVVPVTDVAAAGWADEHHDYPATDIFVSCGAGIVSPVNGTMLEVRRQNRYDPATDNPATRGGRSLTILGDDGVRYYLAHLDTIVEPIAPDDRVTAGQALGTMGQTGRASACHLHFAISPPCPGPEWSVRRGVVWPYPYLDAWRDGEQRSPADEVAAWQADHPTACADAMADPDAPDA